MKSIATAAQERIRALPFLEELLVQGLINVSAVARLLQADIERDTMKSVSVMSIVMAIKRLAQKNEPRNLSVVHGPHYRPELIVRSNLFEITIQNSPTLMERQKNLLEQASKLQGNFVTITHGVFETTIIANAAVREMVLSLYAQEKCISHIDHLSSITLKFPSNIIEQPGVYYQVLKALAWAGISLTEVVSTFSEFTLVLKEEDVDQAFALVKRVFE